MSSLYRLARGHYSLMRLAVYAGLLAITTACNVSTSSMQARLQTIAAGGEAPDLPEDFPSQLGGRSDLAATEVIARYLATPQPPAVGACLFPRRGQYLEGSIFPNHRSQQQLDADVASAYERWKDQYLIAVPAVPAVPGDEARQYRVSFGHAEPERTVSEGQAYGMLLAVLMAGYDSDAQMIFDGLFAFAQSHPSDVDSRFMAWAVPNEGTAAAFDAEADMAYALMLADATWSGSSVVNYQTAAREHIAGLMESMIGPDSMLPMLGDWVDPWGEDYNQLSLRSSDLMAFYFRSFARYSGDARWNEVADSSVEVISRFQTRKPGVTALLPDFLRVSPRPGSGVKPAEPGFLEGEFDGDYYYNAGRVPWRVGLDALFSGSTRSAEQLARFAAFTRAEMKELGPFGLRGGYTLDGEMIEDYFSVFFASPLAVSLMRDSSAQSELNALYDAVYDANEDYFQDSVSLLSLLVLTGNFWDPTTEGCVSRIP